MPPKKLKLKKKTLKNLKTGIDNLFGVSLVSSFTTEESSSISGLRGRIPLRTAFDNNNKVSDEIEKQQEKSVKAQQKRNGQAKLISSREKRMEQIPDFSDIDKFELKVVSCSSSTSYRGGYTSSDIFATASSSNCYGRQQENASSHDNETKKGDANLEPERLACSTPADTRKEGKQCLVICTPIAHVAGQSFMCTPSPRMDMKPSLSLGGTKGKRRMSYVVRNILHRNVANRTLILSNSYWDVYGDGNELATLLKIAGQETLVKFASVFPQSCRDDVEKIGEGLFGEVFRLNNSALKLLPVEGSEKINGEDQKTFAEVLSEVIVSKEVTALGLSGTSQHVTSSFVQFESLSVIQGRFPTYLSRKWDIFHTEKISENDNPKFLPSSQIWILLSYAFGGIPLEDFEVTSTSEALSILRQIALGLAIGEASIGLEHRDLHWGNVLVSRLACSVEDDRSHHLLDSRVYEHPSHGLRVAIIDFTLSRMEQAGNVLFLDLSQDPEIFEGQGDPQFEVYRQMREENGDDWSSFHPRTNLFWLHYLTRKLLASDPPSLDTLDTAILHQVERDLDPKSNIWESTRHFVSGHPTFAPFLC